MSKFLSLKKEYVSYAIVLLFGLLLSAMAANASSTISTSVVTGGGMYASSSAAVTGTVTIYTGGLTVAGAVNASSTVATSGNITVPAGYALDTSGAGDLSVGTTTATAVIIGSSTAKVGIASSTPYVALGVTGTTTSSAGMVVGSAGNAITQILFGRCTYNPAATLTASTSRSTNCTSATGVRSGDRVFITPRNLEFPLVLQSASSTATSDVIQVTVFFVATSTVSTTMTPASNTWDWMAIR